MATQRTTDPPEAAHPNHNPHHERRWLILCVLGLAQLMVVLDATIVNIALPTAQHALGFSDADRQWIVTGYALSFGSLLLLGGRLSDMIGRKRALMIGLAGFAAASALGGFSTSFAMLLCARVLQGSFGALLAPAALAMLTTTFTDPGERGRAFGIYGAIAGGGGAIGLLLGGILTSYVSWRWTLFVNLAIGAVAITGAALLLSNLRSPTRPRLDLPGVITATAGLFALVYGFSHAETTSWSDVYTVGSLVAAVVLLATFVGFERRVSEPLLPLRVVLDRNRGGAFIAMFAAGAAMFGTFLFLTYYMQGTLHYSPVVTGFAYLPMIAGLVVSAQVATNVLLPRFGPKFLVAGGMATAAVAMALLTRTGLDSSYVGTILPALVVLGLGFGLIMAPSMSVATVGLVTDAGIASAMVNTSQQVGGSVGTSLLNTLAASAVTAYAFANRSSATSVATLQAQATVHGYHVVFTYSAVFLVVGAIVAGLLLRRGAVASLAIETEHGRLEPVMVGA
ncbi:MAG: MFS transporter [Acidimicrobiales bacterium]|jgi:EmrB/QacA subfamily drug resistance transporter